MAAFAVIAFCVGAYMPLLSVTIIHRFGFASFGRVLGLAMTFTLLAGLTPLVAGLIHEASGSYLMAFIVTTSPLLIGTILMRGQSRRPNAPRP